MNTLPFLQQLGMVSRQVRDMAVGRKHLLQQLRRNHKIFKKNEEKLVFDLLLELGLGMVCQHEL